MKLVFKDVSYFVDGGKPQYQEKKNLGVGQEPPMLHVYMHVH